MMSKTARGVGWMVGWQVATRLVGLGTTLLLARLLVPADFGVMAIAMGFAQAVESLSFLGVEQALVREKSPTRDMYDTGFTLNVLRSLFMATVLCAIAVPSGVFFAEPRVAHVLFALALGVAVGGFENVGIVEYWRTFAFKMEFRLLIVPRLISSSLTLAIAIGFHSYWALVIGVVAMRVGRVLATYVLHPYRPRFSLKVWRSLLGYSLWTWAQTIAVVVRDRSNMFVIGRLLGPQSVGFYSLGTDLAAVPSSELLAPLSRVAFASFAANRNGEGNAGDTYVRLVASASLLTMPMGVGLSLTADSLVRLAFGPAWDAVVPVIRIVGIASALVVPAYMGSTLFFAHSQMSTCFRVTCAAAFTRVTMLFTLVPSLGLVGAALGLMASDLLESILYLTLVRRHFGVPATAVLRKSGRGIAAAAIMAAVLYGTGLGWAPVSGSALAVGGHLAMTIGLGVIVYFGALLGAWRAMGQPAGAEADWLRLVGRVAGQAAATLRRLRPRRA